MSFSSILLIIVTTCFGSNPRLVNRETLKKTTALPIPAFSVNALKAE
jgi:hypothetical protein